MFRQVVFHLQASGISTMHDQLGRFGRWLFRIAYFHADSVIQLSPDTIDEARGLCAKRAFFVANCAEDEFERFRPLIEAKAAATADRFGFVTCRRSASPKVFWISSRLAIVW